MLHSYSAELLKFRRRPAVWVVLVLWLALEMTFTYLFPYLAYRSAVTPRIAQQLLSEVLPAQVPRQTVTGYPLWGGALIVVLGALYLGSEYSWGTLKTLFSNRPGRLTIYLAQVATLGTALVGLVVVNFLLSGLASLLIAWSAGVTASLPSAGDVIRAMVVGWLILDMWCMFGFSLAILLQGTTLSIGLGLVWILVVENVVRATAPLVDVISTVEKILPGVNAGSLVAALGGLTALSGSTGGTGIAAIVGGAQALWTVVIYLLVFGAVGAVMIRQRDIQGL